MPRVDLEVPDDLLKDFDEATTNKYNTRAEAIRAAMRLLLNSLKEES